MDLAGKVVRDTILRMVKKDMMPLKEFAAAAGIPYTTVIRWAKSGRIKGVTYRDTPIGRYWMVPRGALDALERPKVGRPPKPTSEKKPRAPRARAATKKVRTDAG
jgi:hypothetical protein